MVLWVPQKGVWRVEHNTGSVGSITPGTAVTTGASSSTKGTPAELISSTSFEAYNVFIMATGYGTSAISSQGCLDILIGNSTEEVLIPNLLMGFCGGLGARDRGPKFWEFPLYIPAGSRISAQAAGERTNTPVYVAIYLYGGSGAPRGPVGTSVTTYGITTVPAGTSANAGTSGAEGNWNQITSSTTRNHIALVPSFQNSLDTSTAQKGLQVEVGIGAATEEVVGGSYWYSNDVVETLGGPYPYSPIYQDIPSGTRLSIRSSSNTTGGAYNAVIHAVS